MNLSKALMIAAMGMVSLNLVACASMPAGREPATQSASTGQAAGQNDGQNDGRSMSESQSFEEKMAQWEDHHTGALLHR